MGKRSKQGATLRAKKRADITHHELEEAITEQAHQDRVQSTKNEDLFILDTERKEGAVSQRKRAKYAAKRDNNNNNNDTAAAMKKRKYDPSEKDMRQIQKVLETHGSGAIALAEKGKKRLEPQRLVKRMAGMAKAGKPNFDLWDAPAAADNNNDLDSSSSKKRKATQKMHLVPTGVKAPSGTNPVSMMPAIPLFPATITALDPHFDPPSQPAPNLSKKQLKARIHAQLAAPPKLAVEVAHPGQSYRPDKEHHQDAIGEALSIEIRRNEAEEYTKTPISNGLSDFTKQFIVNDSDEEEDDSSDDDDGENNGAGTKLIKKKEKLTKSQRNKQKRIKAEQTALLERKKSKQFLHQLNEVKIHSKKVTQAEKMNIERQKELAQLKEEKRSQPLGKDVWNGLSQKDPIRAPSLPVALTEELEQTGGGTLRTVTPKGSLMTDRVESMVARNMMRKKKAEGRRIVQGKRRKKLTQAKGTEYLLI